MKHYIRHSVFVVLVAMVFFFLVYLKPWSQDSTGAVIGNSSTEKANITKTVPSLSLADSRIGEKAFSGELPKSTSYLAQTRSGVSDLDPLWDEIQASKSEQDEIKALMKLHDMVIGNPAALTEIMRRFETLPNDKAMKIATSVLTANSEQIPQVLEFSLKLSKNHDPGRRAIAFEILQAIPSLERSSEVSSLAIQALQTEYDPAILSRAISVLRNEKVAPLEAQTIETQLYNFTHHQNANVRAESIKALASRDRTTTTEDAVFQGLSDKSEQVRQAAIEAIGEGKLQSDRLKQGLLDVIISKDEHSVTKAGALDMLGKFQLTQAEYDNYTKARTEITKELKAEYGSNGGG